ncbi:MAG: cyclic nucleotide-binding domain-containing protein [Gammaproteobacteria bacterium]|nr:cyclic nucleotide-binding domain-containing protein [Gammaproteobacteria bacterium]
MTDEHMQNPASDIGASEAMKLEPIASLKAEQVQELLADTHVEKIAAGRYLFREGDLDDRAVYLLRGQVEIANQAGTPARIITGGTTEACHPLADDKPRQVTAMAVTPVEILCVDRQKLDVMLSWGQISAPEDEVIMCEEGIVCINKADWLQTMSRSPTFRNLPVTNIEALLDRLEPMFVKSGQLIIRQGDPGDYFYMIENGVALVTRNPDDDEDSVEMAELGRGTSFGEAALLSDQPRNATITMMSDGILLRLSKQDFIKLLREPTLQWLEFEEALQRVATGKATWIDVRTPSECSHRHLPLSINIPMRDLHKRARELDPKREYICVCQTGRRASAASFVLKQYGLRASILKDGMNNPDIKL